MGSTEDARPGKPWHGLLYDWLANPLLIAVVGAFLVYWLIPQLTRGWQDHAKVLEVKTKLVGDMSDSVGNATMTGRFIASGLIGQATEDPHATQKAFNDAYRDWTIDSAVIGSQLAAYFPKGDLAAKWRSYASVVTDYLQLSARGERADRANQLIEVADYFPDLEKRGKAWWTALLETGPDFQQNYRELSLRILSERDTFVQRVLDTSASGF